MAEFIKVGIDFNKCLGINECGKCAQACPVNIFQKNGSNLSVIEENEDECTLCDLCLKACKPGAITIHRKYE